MKNLFRYALPISIAFGAKTACDTKQNGPDKPDPCPPIEVPVADPVRERMDNAQDDIKAGLASVREMREIIGVDAPEGPRTRINVDGKTLDEIIAILRAKKYAFKPTMRAEFFKLHNEFSAQLDDAMQRIANKIGINIVNFRDTVLTSDLAIGQYPAIFFPGSNSTTIRYRRYAQKFFEKASDLFVLENLSIDDLIQWLDQAYKGLHETQEKLDAINSRTYGLSTLSAFCEEVQLLEHFIAVHKLRIQYARAYIDIILQATENENNRTAKKNFVQKDTTKLFAKYNNNKKQNLHHFARSNLRQKRA